MEDYDEVQDGGVPEFLRDPTGIVRRHWLPMGVALLLGLVGAAALTLLSKPMYRAKASVMVANQQIPEDFVRPTIEEGPVERLNALMGEALSMTSLGEIIEERDIYPELRKTMPLSAAVGTMRQNLIVETQRPVGRAKNFQASQVLLIYFTADDPETAAAVANDVAHRFTYAGVRMRSQQARLTTEFMQRELTAAESVLREQSRGIAEFSRKHRGELPSELDANLRRLDRLQQQRNSLAMQIAEAETRIALYAAEGTSEDTPAARLDGMRDALIAELAVSTETHPNVVSLRRQISMLEEQLSKEARPGVSLADTSGGILMAAARKDLTRLRQQLADTDRQLTELDARVDLTPATQEELDALQQRAGVLRENYLQFLRKVKEAELAESLELAQQGARVAVLDKAHPPLTPETAPWALAAGGSVGAVALALLVGVFLEWRDPVLVSVSALETAGEMHVLGTIPHIS